MSQPPQNSFTSVTTHDRSGVLYIAALLSFIYTTLTFITRIIIKWQILGLDDAAMMTAQIVNIIQFAVLLRALSSGLGKSYGIITDDEYAQSVLAYFGGQIAIYLVLGCSKIATILLVRRLFIKGMQTAWNMCNLIACVTVAWTIASAVLVSAGCSVNGLSPRTSIEICSGIRTRYMVIIITDVITDFALAIVPACLCRNLQMRWTFKLQVLYIFAFRLLLVPLACLFFRYWSLSLDSNDPGVMRTTAVIIQQAQLCISLIAGTIPCLRSFIQSFDTGSAVKAGISNINSSGYGYNSNAHNSSNSADRKEEGYQMMAFENDTRHKATPQVQVDIKEDCQLHQRSSVLKLYADPKFHDPEIDRRSTLESDRKSHRSTQELFIRKDIRWEVTRDA